MTWSARRLLVLAALAAAGGVATAQAVAATGGTQARGRATAGAAKKQPAKAKRAKARAVKLSGGVAWVPASVLSASRPPLTGAASGGAGHGGGANGDGATGTSTTPATATTPTPTTPDPPPAQQALGATVDERGGNYTMVLSRTALTAGTVVVQLINKGEDPHNLRIVRTSPSGGAPADLPETGPQQQSAKTLTLTGGTYYLYCTLQQPVSHETAGMHATLRVDP